MADTKALEASLALGLSRRESNDRTPYTHRPPLEDEVVETYQKAPYRTGYVLSQKPYTVTSPETVEIDGKEYKIKLSEDKTALTMRPAFFFLRSRECVVHQGLLKYMVTDHETNRQGRWRQDIKLFHGSSIGNITV